ncbi:hypothetical protein [Aquibacillus rhizosphaerae]|uniref:Uncharacterized protein n=1 Tax=Aquibacillus rhizosphaerae TaxID=3051431 RepID=A0ABT7L7R7_9BACI|nr:hypothetical protein [Aquibacillus sp. LR5S19]MDL4841906.1 hypothetical protein [Aquibacillus sp. LR5S19]
MKITPDGDPTNNLSYNGSLENKAYYIASSKESLVGKTIPKMVIENVQAAVPGQATVDKLIRKLKKDEK